MGLLDSPSIHEEVAAIRENALRYPVKNKTKIKLEAANVDIEELLAQGYRVRYFKPWHLRISKTDYETEVDVWPTTGKLMVVDSWKSERYDKGFLYKRMNEIFDVEDS